MHHRAASDSLVAPTPFGRPQNSRILLRVTRAFRAGVVASALALSLGAFGSSVEARPYPILFVTQVPVPADFTTIGSTFGNHRGAPDAAARGGDLWILYPDGTRKNLTAAAGYGTTGFQGATGIAVRDPAVHWSGTKAIFSMVIGTPPQYQHLPYYWQLYEITGLGAGDTPVITKVPHQPLDCNNVSPCYASDGRILFTTDRTRNGARHLYPQLDEYEEAPTVSGLWSLDPVSGALALLQHSPSGSFTPIVDSYGRLLFTRWDHLQRDQQADADEYYGGSYGTFDWSSEASDALPLNQRVEMFPEPRPGSPLLVGTNLEGHVFNHFGPWQVNQDGSEEETLLHLGRHEIHSYFARSLKDDPNVQDFFSGSGHRINNFLGVRESVTTPGLYYGIDAPEFYTHACGQILALSAAPGINPDGMDPVYVTHRETSSYTDLPGPNHTGLYRNPLPLSDGTVIAVHTPETRNDENEGTRANPISRYDLALKALVPDGSYWKAGPALTTPIVKTVSYYDPDVLVTYSGALWQLSPVEVRSRSIPPATAVTPLQAPEATIFAQEGVDPAVFTAYLEQNGLGMIVTRNVTTRDDADRQQPFNLRVPGGVSTIGTGGKIYDVSHLQIVQGDLIRGLGGTSDPRDGRRVLARALHDEAAVNPPAPGGPAGSVKVATDGSIAALVPARRALSWQTTAPDGTPVVRERYWLTLQPGEIRTCGSCHGVNTSDQAGHVPPTNPPEALRQLLQFWKAQTDVAEGALEGVFRLVGFAPNPCRDATQLEFDLASSLPDVVVRLFAPNGARVGEQRLGDLSSGRHAIPLSLVEGSHRLPTGVYLYQVDARGQARAQGKLTVTR